MQRMFDIIAWFVILAGVLLIIYMGLRIREAQELREQYQQERRNEIHQKMKYHGTQVVFEEKGKLYFIRNGEKCKL